MSKHQQPNTLAGKTVRLSTNIIDPELSGAEFRVEDWWDRVAGKSWMYCDGNPACIKYAIRSAVSNPSLPIDDEVIYGKVGFYGHLVHISEIVPE